MKPARIVLTMAVLAACSPIAALAQNTTFATSVHIVAGQPAVRVTLATGSADRFYDADVVPGRSYCAEATPSDTEMNSADPALTIYDGEQGQITIPDKGGEEPKGQVADRRCFIAPQTSRIFIQLSPHSAEFENREYSMRFVETTLWTNWFFVGGGYSSYTIVRNTTNSPVTVNIIWRGENGDAAASLLQHVIPANGTFYRDARQAMNCPYPTVCGTLAGSVEVAHTGSPEAIVGSQTTLGRDNGLSFDTILFQRRPW